MFLHACWNFSMFTTGKTPSSQYRLEFWNKILKSKKKSIWLVVHISIHFHSDTDSYSYIQYEDSQENSALDSNVYDIC